MGSHSSQVAFSALRQKLNGYFLFENINTSSYSDPSSVQIETYRSFGKQKTEVKKESFCIRRDTLFLPGG